MIKKAENEIKKFPIRLPKPIWANLKHMSVDLDKSMNQVIIDLIKKASKSEKKN
jgi:hypothetical protein